MRFSVRHFFEPTTEATKPARTLLRIFLGASLVIAGVAHLSFQRVEFLAQVPNWLPLEGDFVVVTSGIVEILLGIALVFLPRYRVSIGWITGAFFILIFPGNISQYVNGIDAFGLDTNQARFLRLFFQPVLVLWAIWSTAAWRDRPNRSINE
jgi:uncharacterized membrane protein